jgi:hypothetical protein
MRPEYSRLAGLQASIIIIGAAITNIAVTLLTAKSFAYGGVVTLASTLFLSWRLSQGDKRDELPAEWCLRQAYRTAIERFAGMILLLALGFKLLKFEPLWMLTGFVITQSAWMMIPVWIKLSTSLDKTENKK